MKREALEYLERGWCPIPAHPRSKKPMVEWAKYITERPTREEVANWWNLWPDANIALVTGKVSGLVVVDLDLKRGVRPEQVYDKAPTDTIVKTGGGGFHLYYAHPGDKHVPNKVGQDGLDIRADGGYVIAPPSVHESGRRYEWLRGPSDLSLAPDFALGLTNAAAPETSEKWLSEILRGVGEGGRNDGCAKLCGYLAKRGVPRDVAYEIVGNWNDKNRPPLPVSEIRTTIESVYKTARRNRQEERALAAPEEFNLMPMGQFMRAYGDHEVQWLVDEWWPAESVGVVNAAPGSYKTWLLFDLAVSVAGGFPFLGRYKVNNPGPVFIIQQEDFHGSVGERIQTIALARNGGLGDFGFDDFSFTIPAVPNLPIYFHPDRKLRFDDPAVLAALGKQVAQLRPRLVMIDPLYSTIGTEDYGAEGAQRMLFLKGLRDKYKTSFVVAHHTKKRTEGKGDRLDAWGSQFLNAWRETGMDIVKKSDTSILVRRTSKTSKPQPPMMVHFDIETETQPWRYATKVEDAPQEEVIAAASEDLKERVLHLLQGGSYRVQEIAEKLSVHRSQVYKAIKTLGPDVTNERGRYSIGKLPEF